MERKVKSLIPIKNKSETLLTGLLLLMWWLLFIWAIGLLVSTVFVNASTVDNKAWIDNKSEVVRIMEFAKSDDLSQPYNYLYLSWNLWSNFYLSWYWVVSDGNTFDEGENINILFWSGNVVRSKNVTVVGRNNKVGNNSDNSVVLWWSGNNIGYGFFDNFVLIWGEENTGYNASNGAFLWWKHNSVWLTGNFVLWGYGNKGFPSNTILWWSWIKIIWWRKNIFAFSDGETDINDLWSNAFYLFVKNGVWLWTNSSTNWLLSSWAVKFGEINIMDESCDSNDVWVMWVWSGCMVGCTEVSKEDENKWEMIGYGSDCKDKCKSSEKCIAIDHFSTDDDEVHSDSFCVWNVNTLHAIQCASNLLDEYENVAYEKKLISNSDNCPSATTENNKCVFKCEAAYPNLNADRTRCEK